MDIKSYEIDSVIETLQKMGLKGLMEYTDVFVINHLCNRGVIPNPTDNGIKSYLIENGIPPRETQELLNKYKRWKEVLPEYSFSLNEKLHKTQLMYESNSVVPFKWIGRGGNKKLIGFVGEPQKDNIVVYESSGNVSPLVICNIDTNRWSITWNNYVELTTPQQSYIVDKVKDLSKMRWLS